MKKQNGELTDILKELKTATDEKRTVTVGVLIDALDQRGYGPALAILPLIELTPIGGMPGFPTLLSITLGLITLRLLMGYDQFWAPDWLRERKLKSRQVMKSMEWLKPVTQRIDAKLHERLSPLARPAGRRAACIVILCLLLTVPLLELVPFATSVPMLAISLFGLGLLYRDGLLLLLGFIGAAVAAGGGLWALLSSGGG